MTEDLVISAQHMNGPESFIIEIEASKVSTLLNEFNGDLGLVAGHLKLMNKRMVLLNPVSNSNLTACSLSNLMYCLQKFQNNTEEDQEGEPIEGAEAEGQLDQ